jgi:predicted Zn-dependent peptidase
MTASPFKFHTLANGLQIIGQPSNTRRSAALGFFVKTGARDETAVEAGVSHFLEHMLFKGTPRRSALELTYEMGSIGAQSNAFTSEENTVYYGAVLPEFAPRLLDILADMMRPALRQEDFDTEKQVILEEIALYQDKPHFYLFEHALGDYFGNHPAGNSVLGSVDSIRALTRDQMQQYFERRYAPNNMTLVASGNIDFDELISDAERLTGGWLPQQCGREVRAHTAQSIQKQYLKKNVHQNHVLLMTTSASVKDRERYDLALVALMLGDSVGSRLYWELIDTGLADSAGADTEERVDTGVFSLYASTTQDKFEEVRDILHRAACEAATYSDEDLERAKTKLITRLVQSNELPMGQLMALGIEWNQRREVETLAETLARVRQVSRTSIAAALERFPLRTWSEFTLQAG